MKKVLILAYRFPPFSGIGAVRMTSITKYLPDYGWQPYVYTTDWTRDNCTKYDANYGAESKAKVVGRSARIDDPVARLPILGKLGRLSTEVRNRETWYRQGRKDTARLLKEMSGIDAIIASYPIMRGLSLADWISRHHNIPWVADFRDVVEQLFSATRPVVRRFERAAQSSSAVTTVSEPLAETLRGRYQQPVHVIPNGFDLKPIERKSVTEKQAQSHFEIVYTGLIYPVGHPARISPLILFDALDQLKQQNRVDLDDIRVRLIGSSAARVKSHFAGRDSERCVEIVEWMSREEVLEAQLGATVLLSLGSGEMKGIMTGKIFEYLNSGRPILSIPRDSDAIGRILAETNAGVTVDTVDEIANYIQELYGEWKVHRCLPDVPQSELVNQFHWRNQTERFADVLNDVVKPKSEPS